MAFPLQRPIFSLYAAPMSKSLDDFADADVWKGLILFGLNTATYKMAFANCLLEFNRRNQTTVHWDDLSAMFLNQYIIKLRDNPLPQQSNPSRLTFMERVVNELNAGRLSQGNAIDRVSERGLRDVVRRFQTIGQYRDLVGQRFFTFDYGKSLSLKDNLMRFEEAQVQELEEESAARWNLLEGAFAINQQNFELSNDIRDVYLNQGYSRRALTSNRPFLTGYQGNTCFYCAVGFESEIHVDHVLPRQVIHHDDMWNLVLAHSECNMLKADRLVGPHFIEKLIVRNENIMGSNHPWKRKISESLGSTPRQRASSVRGHYENVKKVLGTNYWGGADSYNPASDPFYMRLITVLNNNNEALLA